MLASSATRLSRADTAATVSFATGFVVGVDVVKSVVLVTGCSSTSSGAGFEVLLELSSGSLLLVDETTIGET
jgi:hypothetical protein